MPAAKARSNAALIPVFDTATATSERILYVAMRLFGEHGVDRVSLKEISDAAGNRNKSAVGYHFMNKQGLIDALLQRIDQDVGKAIGAALSEISTRLDDGAKLEVADFGKAVLDPVVNFYVSSPYGRDAFRLLARLMHDPVEGLPIAVRRRNGARIETAMQILRRLQPNKPMRLIEQHVHHTIMATINGLSLADRFLAIRTDRWAANELEAFFDSYAGFLAFGLSSGAGDANSKN